MQKVERALTLTADGDYDFVMNRLILKPDPSRMSRKPTTSMFAFSEAAWVSRVEFYLEKGIARLKEKDWTNIMRAAAEYSNAIKDKASDAATRRKGRAMTEEELELTWDSDSDPGPET